MKAELTVPERPATVHLLAVLDVLVLMLVFFVLLTSVTQEAGVSVGLAETGYRLKSYGKPVVVTARGGATPVVYVQQKRVMMDDLEEELRIATEVTGAESMFLKADQLLPVGVERKIIEAGLRQGLNVALIGRQEEAAPSGAPLNGTEPPRSGE